MKVSWKAALLILLSSFLLLEAYLKISFYLSESLPSFVRIYSLRYFDPDGTPRWQPDTRSWHKSYRSSADVLIEVNRFGFRGAEPLESPTRRIVMIGDSTVFNGAVALNETFPYITQQLLRSRTGDNGIEVLNFAIGDTNIIHHYLKLKNHALAFNPHEVLVFIYLNDSTDSLQTATGIDTRFSEIKWYHSLAVKSLLRTIFGLRILFQASKSSRFDWISEFNSKKFLDSHSSWEKMRSEARYDWGAAWNKESWDLIEGWVSKMKELALSAKVPLRLIIMPISPQVEIPFPPRDLYLPQQLALRMAKKVGLPLADPIPYLKRHKTSEPLFYDQCHLTIEGNRLLAEYLTNEVL